MIYHVIHGFLACRVVFLQHFAGLHPCERRRDRRGRVGDDPSHAAGHLGREGGPLALENARLTASSSSF